MTGNADTATKLSTTTGSAPAYACRAWVNFDGTRDTTGATSTANTNRLIRSSGNVASVLRTSQGNYTVNFTIPMSDANYSVVNGCAYENTQDTNVTSIEILSQTNNSFNLRSFGTSSGTSFDSLNCNAAIFGN